ncbi:TPA: hypothetical protein N0F65_005336 [Lagenidium giganteum]|uniref:non-specific serine/threonine protein kinase n=1 Tax=Lagenidium giganteum TaxID=4803 RepID=A0AAV2Z0D2_9STRA|nr:TPA: hypothetical protein N0F65_005336 [Lagenidium giganteum]
MDAYEFVRQIGKGSFGVVSQIIRKSDGKELVWKEVNYGQMTEKEKQLIVSEVNILRELRHPHIVRYLDRVIDKQATKIYIVMEYCEGGDLSQYIKRKKREGSYIDEGFIWHVFTHVFLALKECHRHREGGVVRPILHRDIKPGNIFLDSNNNAKLGDFGLAKELASESRLAQTNVGTPYYMSPEMVNEMTYDERSDIWAFGCLLYEMATLAPPFDATNQLALAKKINAGKFARIPAQYSEGLFQVIRWMLHRQRSKRPRIEDLERVPQLQQKLRAYNSLVSGQSTEYQLQQSYNQKMKELLVIEEDLRRQESALIAREKKLESEFSRRFADLERREAELKKREQMVDLMARKITYGNQKVSSPTTSDGSNSSLDNNNNNSTMATYDGSYAIGSPRRRPSNSSPNRPRAAAPGSPEYDIQLKIPQPPTTSREERSRIYVPTGNNDPLASNRNQTSSEKFGYTRSGSSGYYPSPDMSSGPSLNPRLRDPSDQGVVNMMKGMWKK